MALNYLGSDWGSWGTLGPLKPGGRGLEPRGARTMSCTVPGSESATTRSSVAELVRNPPHHMAQPPQPLSHSIPHPLYLCTTSLVVPPTSYSVSPHPVVHIRPHRPHCPAPHTGPHLTTMQLPPRMGGPHLGCLRELQKSSFKGGNPGERDGAESACRPKLPIPLLLAFPAGVLLINRTSYLIN